MALREVLAEFGIKFSDAELKRAEKKIQEATKKLDRFGHKVASTSRAAKGFGGRMGLTAGEVNKFTRANDKAFDSLKRVARNAAVAGAALVGLGVKSVVETGANYEKAISAVGAVSLKSREDISQLDAQAKKLGATTQFTATQSANAMEIMARAGFSTEEILAGVPGVLNAAAASGLEMAEVADHVSNVLKGMGLEASEAARVSDVLALASSKTNSTIGTLGESMRNVAATARQLGVPLEDTVAAVASLQDVGLDASVAGSSLNTMLTKMAKPSKAVQKQMDDMGISFRDANGNMLPFAKVIEQLNVASEKAGGNFDQVAFFADLVGLRGQKAAANLAHLFETGKVSTLTEQLKDAEGSAEKMAKLKMDNVIGDWTLFTSAVDGLKTELFETQSGPLRDLIQSATKWVGQNKELIKLEVAAWILKIRDGVRDALPILKGLATFFAVKGALVVGIKAARTAMWGYHAATKAVLVANEALAGFKGAKTIATSFTTIGTGAGTAAVGVGALGAALGATALAIAAVSAAVYNLVKLVEEVGGIDAFFEGIKRAGKTIAIGGGGLMPWKVLQSFKEGAESVRDEEARREAAGRSRKEGAARWETLDKLQGEPLTNEQILNLLPAIQQTAAAGRGGRGEQNIQANDQRRQNVTVNVTGGGTSEEIGERIGRNVVNKLGNPTSTDALEQALVPGVE